MRQLMLVVVLVAAAFLGGAFVNGPGLQWAQARLLRSLNLNNAGEITSVDLKPTAGTEMSADASRSGKPTTDTTQSPLAPIPSLLTEDESAKYDASDRPVVSHPGPKSSGNVSGPARSGPLSSSRSIKRPIAPASSPASEPMPSDPDVTPASMASASTNSRSDQNIAPAILDTLAALMPPTPSSSRSPSPSSLPTAQPLPTVRKSAGDGNENWPVLERKMQSLGVSRYTMEGEPGGRVVFSCLIPLAGRQAVTQRFEAEGDDLVQAARAALRRIVLWRATQPSSQ